jgi:hypothetical protein
VDTARRYALASNLLGLLGLAGLAVATAMLAGPWWGLAGASAGALGMAYALDTQARRAVAIAARRRPLDESRRAA